ncbi:MAG: DNA mismatch repair endonuclease MutL [Planctomycetes bacterium]|nr:DNA mismatch repair endonuclease MutL [Planctomycetota bacterium]
MSAPIRPLPPSVVDVIAAGEVVERPASVVKELVENALDAGARRVAVSIEDGGRTLIRVEDDGEGIPPADLPLAFEAHATSKIRGVEDLDAVATYGFRGEALASIGAVSEASVTSRVRGAADGFRVEDRRGEVSAPAPAAHPEGTTVEVRALFAALPARRKFLRAPGTEAARATEAVVRFLLGRPDVAFTLSVDGRTVLRAPAGEPPRERAARALGADRAEALLPVSRREGGIAVEGFIAPPSAAEKGRPPQFLFVNGRSVNDRTILHAVRHALEGLVTVHRQPALVLAVTLPPGEVDVNVHPAKSEVRFRRPSAVHAAVEAAVREAVLAGEGAPGIPVEALRGRDGIRDALDAYLGGAGAAAMRASTLEFPPPGLPFAPGAERTAFSPGTAAAPPPPAGARPPLRVLQVRNSFLVVEAEDGIAVVDQHALHERVLLERLRARARAGGAETQRLLVPEVLEVGPADAARVEEAAPLLAKAGLLLERFGPGAVAVQGVPRALAARPVRAVAAAALRRLREERDASRGEALLEGVLESMACHGAVRAGDPLTEEEARALLEEGRSLDTGGHCAHGRPTELRISFDDLEKRFRRKGL